MTEQIKKTAKHFAYQGYRVIVPALFSQDSVIPYADAVKGRALANPTRPIYVYDGAGHAFSNAD